MPDNLKRTQPEDPKKININQSWEVGYWSARLGVSESKLKRAVNAVGVMVENVEKWLSKN
ncbi:MAG: DUF3606 domain-containing protein [Waterburya sp.]